MSRFGGLIGRKTFVENRISEANPAPAPEPDDNVLELDPELFSPIANQVGKENEEVRNLLIDAEYRISDLDAVKESIAKLVEPVSKTLRAFEVAKSERLSLQTVLNTTRIAYGKLRNEMSAIEKRATTLESECSRLQEDLSLAQQYVASLETAKTEQAADIDGKRSEIADLQRRVQHDTAELQNVREENRRISERIIAADKKMGQIESELDSARQRALVAERERTTLQAALDETLSEHSRVSRRLVEADNAITAASARLRQLESALAEAEADRTRLSQDGDATKEKLQNELNTQRMRFDALQTRAATTEKLLDEARQTLAARADEIRSYERRMTEATLMRNMIEGKLGQIESGIAERDAQIYDLDQARATLAERAEVLTRAVTTRENAYNRAQEKIGLLEERIEQIEGEAKGIRDSSELQIEELNTQLHRERVERTMVEGALDSARQDIARLMRDIAVLQNRPVPAEKPGHLPPAPRLVSVA
jgi:crescentin